MRDDLIREAAKLLHEGKLVAFPTETVYGLGADASNVDAIKRLYEAKGRPSSHPVIVHIHSLEMIADWAVDVPSIFNKLVETFWPGPLTVVLKRSPRVLDEVTGGQDTVAIRMPDHPLALALLREFGGGLVAPSANRFGRLSPTLAQHVRDEFSSEVALVLDGGACQVGIESTIIDLSLLSSKIPKILRPGMLSGSDISNVIGPVQDGVSERDSTSVRVPGSLASHYAPVTPLHLVLSEYFLPFVEERLKEHKTLSVISFQPPIAGFSENDWITLPCEPYEFARKIYSSLRQLDSNRSQVIVVESPPTSDLVWRGIQDRLMRAAHKL